ncbi:ovochymase-like isoform X2 [Ptychodera flava]|uniref:ovochymase-like isoform X2 n=1 Tax=Ptychodera flava TaxID=63121 RepID=UPI00396A62D1
MMDMSSIVRNVITIVVLGVSLCHAQSYPGCGDKGVSSNIIGGSATTVEEWPWQSMINIYSLIGLESHICGGTLIHPKWVLTAAHCINNWLDPVPYSVNLGTTYRTAFNESSRVLVDVKNVYIHPDFDLDTYDNDIALLEFVESVNLTSYIEPACIAGPSQDFSGQNCWTTGWGSTQEEDLPSEVLREASVPLITDEDCQSLLEPGQILTENMLCASYNNSGTCFLDGGGPLVCEDAGSWYIAGIVSRGNACLNPSAPGIFTKVSNYADNFIGHVFDGTTPPTKPSVCGSGEFMCDGGMCLNELTTRCNSAPDCPSLDDEAYCSKEWQLFKPTYDAITSSLDEIGKVSTGILQEDCMNLCLNETSFVCRAFDYVAASGLCHLINSTALPVSLNTSVEGVEHWDLRTVQDCGAYFLNLDGFFGSPRYMLIRPEVETWCRITISNSQLDAVVQLNISSVMTQKDALSSCEDAFERLIVYDGNSLSSPVLGIFCLANIPAVITSTGNTVLLEYIEDEGLVDTQGFLVRYNIRYYQEVTLDEAPGVVTSPLWPNDYPPEREYHWTIQAPQAYHIKLDFITFRLEEDDELCSNDKDHLTIYWGLTEVSPHFGTFCGVLFISQSVESPGRYAHLVFKSDGENSDSGFEIQYDFIQDDEPTQPGIITVPIITGATNPVITDPVCGIKGVSSNIIGGSATTVEEWPWQSMINIYSLIGIESHICGGTLIHPKWVLTAAHCINNWLDPVPYSVNLGTTYRTAFNESSRVLVDVKNVYIHPDFDLDTYDNDIALLEFVESVNLTSYIGPACVSSPSQDFSGQNCWTTGWGSTQGEDLPSEVLREASVPVITNEDCQSLLEPGQILTENMMCASYNNSGTCFLDGGGPLVCEDAGVWYVAGIVSRGNACLNPESPGIFTKVSNYADNFIGNVFDGTIPPTKPSVCGSGEFMCQGGMCLNELTTRCNSVPDCPSLDDEAYCSKEWQLFKPTYDAITSSLDEIGKVSTGILQEDCMNLCLNETSFVCRAFDYVAASGLCHLINSTALPVSLNTSVEGVEHWDLRTVQDCGAYFLDLNGFFGSPRYTLNRPAMNTWCRITISNSQLDAVVQLNTSSVMTQKNVLSTCEDSFDRFIVYDGNSLSAPVLGVYCLANIPSIITSSGNTVILEYLEKRSLVETQGFLMRYNIRYYQEVMLNEAPGVLTSPLWPNDYPPEREYHWTIQAPQAYHIKLDFITFRLEEDDELCSNDKDHLTIYWGLTEVSPHFGTFCGVLFISQSVESPGRYAHLVFKSDGENSESGFEIQYDFIQDDEPTQPGIITVPIITGATNPVITDPVCGIKGVSSNIIGGSATTVEEWPWQSMINIYSLIGIESHICGGTLIHPKWVLTAAHCINNWLDPVPYSVNLGTTYRTAFNESSRVLVDVKNVYIHPDFDLDTYDNDIALLEFVESVNLTSYIGPACVSTPSQDFSGQNCWTTGWGSTQEEDLPSEVLREASVPVITNEDCQSLLEPGQILTENMMCASYNNSGTCFLDGGGPLVCEDAGVWYVAGIVSRGNACLNPESPGIFTKVSNYADNFIGNVFDGTIPPTKPSVCGFGEFMCQGGMCLNELTTRCNSVPDCPSLDDEAYCSKEWQLFKPTYDAITSSLDEIGKVSTGILQEDCMNLCLNETSFVCRAFDYVAASGLCHLIDSTALPVSLNTSVEGVEHWDLRTVQDCGAYFLDLNGFFGSPRYTLNRPALNTWCRITISNSQLDAVVQLNTSSVMTQKNVLSTCEDSFDRFIVYDGNSLSAPVLGVYCLANIPSIITSSGNTVILEYLEKRSLVETQGS